MTGCCSAEWQPGMGSGIAKKKEPFTLPKSFFLEPFRLDDLRIFTAMIRTG